MQNKRTSSSHLSSQTVCYSTYVVVVVVLLLLLLLFSVWRRCCRWCCYYHCCCCYTCLVFLVGPNSINIHIKRFCWWSANSKDTISSFWHLFVFNFQTFSTFYVFKIIIFHIMFVYIYTCSFKVAGTCICMSLLRRNTI